MLGSLVVCFFALHRSVPELPDITVYLEALRDRIVGKTIEHAILASPFLLRSVDPPFDRVNGRTVVSVERLGKRLVIGLGDDLWLVLHLMIAGRLHWKKKKPARPSRRDLLSLGFATGTLTLTETGTKKRASLYIVRGRTNLRTHDPGGLELLQIDCETFRQRLTRSNHTLKRALTDPRIFSGVGNAYSDEILHHAGLSPVTLTQSLEHSEITRLFNSAREVLDQWTKRLRRQTGTKFPEKVTAFRPEMSVHGRYGEPCPTCTTKVQRIRYASNETNYCPRCQTGGKLLADRALSRLLKSDWPKTIDELESKLD